MIFYKRLISSLIAVFALLTIHFLGGGNKVFLFLAIIIVFLGIKETYFLFFPSKKNDYLINKQLFYIVSILCFFVALFITYNLAVIVMILCLINILIIFYFSNKNFDELFSQLATMNFGIFYGAILPVFTCKLILTKDNLWFFYIFLIIIFSGDIFAYLFGSWIGKRKISNFISPKKSLEGSIFGLLASGLACWLSFMLFLKINNVSLIFMGVIVGAFGQLGDFFESFLKRKNKIKDSGNIMPGHGGVLDRLDAVYFASPIYWVIISFYNFGLY